MPFKSEKQRSWMYANKPEMAKEWESHTPKVKLPDRVSEAFKMARKKRKKFRG